MGMDTYNHRRAVDDIYPQDWWDTNREEIDKRFIWEFKLPVKGDLILDTIDSSIHPFVFNGWSSYEREYPVIIILKEKPQYEYVTDMVKREPNEGDYVIEDMIREIRPFMIGSHSHRNRIILTKREVK